MPDNRHIASGFEIPTERYSDQPYVVKTEDGAWLCTLTTGGGVEGASGQHVIATRSIDQGRTWSAPVACGNRQTDPKPPTPCLSKCLARRIYLFLQSQQR